MNDHNPPSPFVAAWVRRVAGAEGANRRALDVAMGRGRHAHLMGAAGFTVFGVDSRFDAVRDAMRLGHLQHVTIHGWCADLTRHPLPSRRFGLIVVARYLQRDLFAALSDALAPGGVLVYETFTESQLALGRGPTSPDHLLRPGELREQFEATHGLDVLFHEEIAAPEAVARLAARRREEP